MIKKPLLNLSHQFQPDLREQQYHHENERDGSHYSSDYFDYEHGERSSPDRYYNPDRFSRDDLYVIVFIIL